MKAWVLVLATAGGCSRGSPAKRRPVLIEGKALTIAAWQAGCGAEVTTDTIPLSEVSHEMSSSRPLEEMSMERWTCAARSGVLGQVVLDPGDHMIYEITITGPRGMSRDDFGAASAQLLRPFIAEEYQYDVLRFPTGAASPPVGCGAEFIGHISFGGCDVGNPDGKAPSFTVIP